MDLFAIISRLEQEFYVKHKFSDKDLEPLCFVPHLYPGFRLGSLLHREQTNMYSILSHYFAGLDAGSGCGVCLCIPLFCLEFPRLSQ